MFIVIIGRVNGDVIYFGPFKMKIRAEQYARACAHEIPGFSKWHIKELVVPYKERLLIRNSMQEGKPEE